MISSTAGTNRSGLVLSVVDLAVPVQSEIRCIALLGASRLKNAWRISDIRDGADCIAHAPTAGERIGSIELLQENGQTVVFDLDWPLQEAQLIETLNRIGEQRAAHPAKPRAERGSNVSWMNHLIGSFGNRRRQEPALVAAIDKRSAISAYLSKFGKAEAARPSINILFVGSPGSGKTTAIATASTSAVHSTEVDATDTVATLKQRTTIALDYGECDVDNYRVRLYGTPGQLRFAHMIKQTLATCDAALILADATSPDPFEDVRQYAQLLAGFGNNRPLMVAYTHLDQGKMPSDLRNKISELLGRRVPGVPLDPRDRSSVIRSLSLLANTSAAASAPAFGNTASPAARSA